jgi:acyl carrier protein
MSDNLSLLFNIVAEIMEVDPKTITEESSQDTLSNWDSQAMVNLVTALESSFCVQFELLEITNLLTVGIIKSILIEKNVQF